MRAIAAPLGHSLSESPPFSPFFFIVLDFLGTQVLELQCCPQTGQGQQSFPRAAIGCSPALTSGSSSIRILGITHTYAVCST
jgi:hypothetical protein